MHHRFALGVLLLGGCTFNAPPPASYRCSPENPACPPGQTCVANLCVSTSADARIDGARDAKNLEVRADGAGDGTRPDLRKDLASADLPGADLPAVDLPKADLKGDLPKGDLPPPPFDLPPPPPCGNGVLDPGEDCDGSVFPLGKSTCAAYNRNGGTLGCTNTCTVDLSKCCFAGVPPAVNPPVSRIVSPLVGNDATTQPLCTPYRTITAALQGAPGGTVVWAMPGTYSSTTNGESFPITLPAATALLGDETTRGLGGGNPTLVSGSGAATGGPATFQTGGNAKLSGFRIVGPTTTGAAIVVTGQNTNISANTLEGHGGVRVEKGGSGSTCPLILQNTINTSDVGVQTDCPTTQIQTNTFNGTAVGVIHLGGNAMIHGNTFNGCASFGLQINAGSPTVTQSTFSGGGGAFSGAGINVGLVAGASSATPKIRGATFPSTLAIVGVRIVENGKPDLGTGSDPGNNKFGIARLALVAPSVTIDAVGNDWAPPAPNNPTCSPPLPPGIGQIQISGVGSTVIWGTTSGQRCQNP